MSTSAQVATNQANSQHSTGPKTEEGKAVSCLNNFRHGLAGVQFSVLPGECEEEYDTLVAGLKTEHQPATITECILVEKLAQHFWLSQRAQRYADLSMDNEKQFSLFLRYQTTNDRAFHKCLDQLLKLRAEKRKAEIGFESQKRQEAEAAAKQELNQAKARLANAKAADLEFETELRSYIEAPLPGNVQIPFDELKGVLKYALTEVARNLHQNAERKQALAA
jgi:low affinity Fe/Cu permease